MVPSKRSFDVALAAERLDDRMAGEGLLDLRVELAGAAPLGQVLRSGPGGDHAHPEDRERHRGQRDQGEQPRDREHHHRDADQQQDRGQHLAERLLQALGEVVEVVGDAAEEVATRLVVDVAQRQPVDLRLGLLAQVQHRALHEAGDHPRRRHLQQRRHDVQRDGQPERAVELTEVDAVAAVRARR